MLCLFEVLLISLNSTTSLSRVSKKPIFLLHKSSTLTLSASLRMAAEPVENGSTAVSGSEQVPPVSETLTESDTQATETLAVEKKWPGWPGDSVFRLVVPVLKVGSIIGRKGELIKKLCEETKARVRILEGALGTADRIVLISGKEEPDARIPPAMNAVLRVFKRISGMGETEAEGTAAAAAPCSIRLLVATSQAINLIGKQGSQIKSIQESTGASVRVLSGEEMPLYATSDERIVEIQGETLKVYNALEAVTGHLRKFLVDHSVIPLFEKSGNATASQERAVDAWADKTQPFQPSSKTSVTSDYPLSLKRESLFLDRETQLDSQMQHSTLSLYGQDPVLSGLRSSGLGRAAPIVTQITQTMQIPLSYAEDIIGIGGANIGYIRRTSGAILTVQESRVPDEIVVEIKGTTSQVHTAQQLIHDFIAGHKEPVASSYGHIDSGLRSSSYSHQGNNPYPSSSLAPPSYGGYGSSGVGGYGSSGLGGYGGFRL